MIRFCNVILLLTLFLYGKINNYGQIVELSPISNQSNDSTIILDEITVGAYLINGRLHNIPGSLAVISGDDINISDGLNISSVLNTLPGVSMQSGTFTTNRIVIRGIGSRTPYNSNRIRAYLNGIPLTSADGISTPEEIDLLSIGRIELIKGPASTLYGSGLGGSINMYSPVKTQSEGQINVQHGSFNTSKAHLSGTVNIGKASIWGSVSHLLSDGYRENNHFKRTTLISTVKWKQPDWSINSTFLLIDENGGIPSSIGISLFNDNPRAAAPNWIAIKGYKKFRKGIAGITLTNNLSERITNAFTVFGKWNNSYERRPFNNLDDLSLSAGFRNKLILHYTKTEWIFGTELITEQYNWKLDLNGVLINENRENRKQMGLYAMLYYRPLTEKLNISFAGALNYISYRLTDLYKTNADQSGKHIFPLIFSPRIGVNFAPSDKLAFYSSIGHGYSLPSPEETLLPEGDVNNEIKPEQGFQYEIGARLYFFGRSVFIDGTIYRIDLNNLLVTKRIAEDIFTGINAGKTRHQGIEIQLHNRWLSLNRFPGKITSIISYNRSLNRFINFTDNDSTYDRNYLPGIPNQIIQLRVKWTPVKLMEVETHLQYTGDQYLNDSNSLQYPGYLLMNFKVETKFKLKKNFEFNLYAGINNLFNTSYASMLIINAVGFGNNEPRYYYPGLPGHVYAGIQFQF